MSEATFTNKVNIRSNAKVADNDIGDLFVGDRVYGNVSNGWIGFARVYRTNGTIDNIAGYAAIQDPINTSLKYAVLRDNPEPVTPPSSTTLVKPLTITIEGDGYETVTVTVNPK